MIRSISKIQNLHGKYLFKHQGLFVVSNQATPWHRDTFADSWNAIPLTSVDQSHSAHLAIQGGLAQLMASVPKISCWNL